MTTQTETRSDGSGCLVALLVVAGVIALIAVPVLNQHAKQRHGPHAFSAWRYMLQHTPEPEDDGRFWRGTDAKGRDYYVLKLKQLPGKPTTYAIVIVVGGILVTAFLVQNKRGVDRIKAKCE
jgi:ABC-type dipeptide/oligopeptide/nickel transport system permease subunit